MSKRIEELEKEKEYWRNLSKKNDTNVAFFIAFRQAEARIEERKQAEKEIKELEDIIDKKNIAINKLNEELKQKITGEEK